MGLGTTGIEDPPREWYVPHRVIIFLGALLTVVAVIGGTLGIVNTNRAAQSIAQISDRYIPLQAPVREIRASIAAFQADADKAFAGGTPAPSLLAAALANSTATDKTYLQLQRLLSASATAGLAPHLASQMTAYVSARSKLGVFLFGEATNAYTTQIAATEQTTETTLDNGLAALQATISGRLADAAQAAGAASRAARDALIWSIAIGGAFAIIVTSILAGKALRVERDLARSEATQLDLTRRNEFEARLQRGLEMSKSEAPLFGLVAESLGVAAPGLHSELLLAESSQAHFRQVLTGSGCTQDGGCGVVSPEDCPAASRGQSMVFPSSTAIDACPNLRGRGCSALCVPVSISGSSVGVFHVTSTEGTPPSESVRGDVEVVARRASERLAMLRAFELSETQANSDSLTGLLTRRSLEGAIRDLESGGTSYAVAYGDLDHFKQLNDVFGHDAGDRALRAFSQVLRDSLRPADIAGRYGGEEFVIVLPGCPIEEALVVLDRVRLALAARLTSAQIPNFTVSFGLASSDQGTGFSQVINLADQALLGAKAGGRNQVTVAGRTAPSEPTSTSDPTGGTPTQVLWDPSMLELLDRDTVSHVAGRPDG